MICAGRCKIIRKIVDYPLAQNHNVGLSSELSCLRSAGNHWSPRRKENRIGQKFGDSTMFGMFNNHAQQDNQAEYSLFNVAHRFVGVYGHGYIEI
jgi:hypothetical protein